MATVTKLQFSIKERKYFRIGRTHIFVGFNEAMYNKVRKMGLFDIGAIHIVYTNKPVGDDLVYVNKLINLMRDRSKRKESGVNLRVFVKFHIPIVYRKDKLRETINNAITEPFSEKGYMFANANINTVFPFGPNDQYALIFQWKDKYAELDIGCNHNSTASMSPISVDFGRYMYDED